MEEQVKTILKSVVIGSALVVMLFGGIETQAPLGIRLVPDAHAIIGLPFTPLSFAGVARRTAFRTMMWSGAAASASSAAAAQHQAAAAQQQAAAAQQQAAAAQQQAAAAHHQAAAAAAPPPAAAGHILPLGTVVSSLPAGCISTPVGGRDYFYCGGNFYRAAFQGNNLVYVTAKPG
jgi:pyruvate/2-oxoglutarate dehydrogenase complex dihydrolipoamide acyltransferase (E2) component